VPTPDPAFLPIGNFRTLASLAPGGFESSGVSKVSIVIDAPSALREQRTQTLTMSLNIPHREKLNGSAAATKAVILVTRSPMTQQGFS
jgi:hypothetical protein